MTNNDKWTRRFLALAEHVAGWSKDPSTQAGAVIVRPNRTVASMGFNGFPRGLPDVPELLANREEKYRRVIHCEMNAVLHAREPVAGYTLYTWPFFTCERCAVHMIQAGIKRVVAPELPEDLKERWGEALQFAQGLYRTACVSTLLVRRDL
jgi:dCMP deaminase